ncbi:MAG: 16S rRNA (cytosine(1402)-N(4))-methyltransferase RsmH [Bacteroidaceae bacterium]|nr:16S rRNA (cytosine(1402)-N(4))-methyltransferase RsmH [Bacteroidaceae bacterium]
MNQEQQYHVPVLLHESVEAVVTNPDGIYVDLTFGGGGHSREILSHLSEKGHLYSFDQDADTLKNRIDDNRFTFVYSNFRYLKNFLRYYNVDKVDGILADLGVSWHHFDDSRRGFSFRFEADIDMRMNQKGGKSAADVLNKYSEEELSTVFYLYGELDNSRKIARRIVQSRNDKAISTTTDLIDIVSPLLGYDRQKKDLAKVFQALRIEVNHEMEALSSMLEQTQQVLKSAGRLSVITYHSLEDRMVKNLIKSGNINGDIRQDFYGNRNVPFKQIGKPVVPSQTEQLQNPRSRSAKLRVAEKL